MLHGRCIRNVRLNLLEIITTIPNEFTSSTQRTPVKRERERERERDIKRETPLLHLYECHFNDVALIRGEIEKENKKRHR